MGRKNPTLPQSRRASAWPMGLPAGFVTAAESTSVAAARETLEEASVAVEIQHAYALFHVPHADQLRIIF